MSRPPVDSVYRETAALIPPQAVSEYLSLSPWQLERRDEIKEIWRLRGEDGAIIGRLMLPLAADYSDFQDRFYDALRALAFANDWDAYQLQDQILATRADLLFVRLDQPTGDGTISFKQAQATMKAIYGMIRSAAQEAAGNAALGQYEQPATVDRFLSEDVRLGHTKHGSFIFTVATRFHGTADPDQLQPGNQVAASADGIFARSTMRRLAYNLETARTILEKRSGSIGSDIIERTTPAYPTFLKSLEEIAKPKGLKSVELSFQWAISALRPDVRMDPIKFDHDAVLIFSRARRVLQSYGTIERAAIASVVPEPRTIVGPVFSLARENTGRNAGQVVVFADTGHGRHGVHVELSGENHDLAIRAYRENIPLTLSGLLVSERGEWHLIGDIDLDISALK